MNLLPPEHRGLFDTLCMPRTGGTLCSETKPRMHWFSLLGFNFPWLHFYFLIAEQDCLINSGLRA